MLAPGFVPRSATLEPVTYYNKLPPAVQVNLCLVLDPMLATGGSAIATVDILKLVGCWEDQVPGPDRHPRRCRGVSAAHPDVPIHLAGLTMQRSGLLVTPGLGNQAIGSSDG